MKIVRARTARLATTPWMLLPVVLIAAAGVAGCESSGNILGNQPDVKISQPAPTPKTMRVAVYPVLAAPDPLNKQIQAEVAGAIDKSRFSVITVTDGSTPATDYQLRGYATASRDKGGAKFAYFFDVLDANGQKLNRIAGEEPLPKAPAKSKDLWPSVGPDIVKSVAGKTAASFATSVPAAGPSPATGSPPSGAQPIAAAPAIASGAAASSPAVARANDIAANGVTTGSVNAGGKPPTGPLTVAIPSVSGAPGDGDKSLTAALRSELKKQGLTVVDAAASATYRVHGQVSTSTNEAGAESIKIAWEVKDGTGNRMATVSQGNTIEKGSLNGAWGATAGDIAAAASAAIVPLLKKPETATGAVPGRQASAAPATQSAAADGVYNTAAR